MSAVFMQILKLGDVREGVKDGRQWRMQEAQCMLLDESGEVVEVGVYNLRKDEIGKITQGLYAPRYALSTGKADKNKGQVVASISGWTPMVKGAKGMVPAEAATAEAIASVKAK